MSSFINNLIIRGGGNHKAGLVQNTHFALHRMASGRSQKHSQNVLNDGIFFENMFSQVAEGCSCSFNLWCEYPASTTVTLSYSIPTVPKSDLTAYIANIILFVTKFTTDSIALRLQTPATQLDWSIQDPSRCYQALSGTGVYDPTSTTPAPGVVGGDGSGTKPVYGQERTFPFYSLEDKTQTWSIGYLVDRIKQINPDIKIYILPNLGKSCWVQSQSGTAAVANSGGTVTKQPTGNGTRDNNARPSLATDPSGISVVTDYPLELETNKQTVESFWSAVHFYRYYNDLLKEKIGYNFDGVIIETEGMPLAEPTVPGLAQADAEVQKTYSLFSSQLSSTIKNAGVYSYTNTPTQGEGITDINFGLTGSPTISKTINQLNTVPISSSTTGDSNKINITTLWPQYYNLFDRTEDPHDIAEQGAYSSKNYEKVVNMIDSQAPWYISDNNTTAEVMGMLSIETPYVRYYNRNTYDISYNRTRRAFFGKGGWTWDMVCSAANTLFGPNGSKSRKLSNGETIKPTIYSGDLLSTQSGKIIGGLEQSAAQGTPLPTLDANAFKTTSCK